MKRIVRLACVLAGLAAAASEAVAAAAATCTVETAVWSVQTAAARERFKDLARPCAWWRRRTPQAGGCRSVRAGPGRRASTRDLANVVDFWPTAKLRYETDKAALAGNGSTAWADLKRRDLALRNFLDVTDKIFPSDFEKHVALISRIEDLLGAGPSSP
jgi:hypothetical protein